jgi:hypothetical protein
LKIIIGFGNAVAQKAFLKRNAVFVKTLPALMKTASKILLPPKKAKAVDYATGVIFFLNRLIAEEFSEILVMAANGYGMAAKRLLRGMFERSVASAYIETDLASAERFLKFGEIQYLKYINMKKRYFKVDLLKAAELKELQDYVVKIKPEFQRPNCAKCCDGTKCKPREAFSWTELSLEAQALKVGMEKWYIDCAFEPTQQLHNSRLAIDTRINKVNGTLSFKSGSQPEDADRAVQLAHLLLVLILGHHNDYFKMKYKREVERRVADVRKSWLEKGKQQTSANRERPK